MSAAVLTLFGFAPVGVCPACQSLIALDGQGKLEPHSVSRWGHNPCSGAGQAPLLTTQAKETPEKRK